MEDLKLKIDANSVDSIEQSFYLIAGQLFDNFVIISNSQFYQIVDIEFYYSNSQFNDSYVHNHDLQLTSGKWYFHPSGVDITIGDGVNHGGILIRGIVKLSSEDMSKDYIKTKTIFGPQNVATELLSNLFPINSKEGNLLSLVRRSEIKIGSLMEKTDLKIRTTRIGLSEKKEQNKNVKFHKRDLRFVIFPFLGHKEKSIIATKMREQFPEMTIDQINKELGSKFLK